MSTRHGVNLSNPLNQFRTYAYHHILIACDSTQTADSLQEDLSTNPENFTVQISKIGDPIEPQFSKTGGSYVVLSNGLNSGRFIIESVTWKTLQYQKTPENDYSPVYSAAEMGTMKIHEPIGIGFYNALAYTFDALQTDPGGVIFLLKTIYIGYDDTNDDTKSSSTSILDTRPTYFGIINVESEFTASGSTYTLMLIGVSDGMSKSYKISGIASGLSIKLNKGSTTLQQAIKLLEIAINKKYNDNIEKMKYATQVNGCGSLNLDAYRMIKYSLLLSNEYNDSKYIIDTFPDNTTDTGENDNIITFGVSVNIDSAIHTIFAHCSAIREEMTNGIKTEDKLIKKYSMLLSSKIDSDANSYNVIYKINKKEILSELANTVTAINKSIDFGEFEGVKIVKQLENGDSLLENGTVVKKSLSSAEKPQLILATPTTISEAQAAVADITELRAQNEQQIRAARDEAYKRDKALRNTKSVINFNYIFTGLNTDIIDFQMRMNTGIAFLHTLTNQRTIPSQLDVINNDVSTGTHRGHQGQVTAVNKHNITRPKSILYFASNSLNTVSRHSKNPSSVATYQSLLSINAAYQNIEVVLNISGNPDLIAGTEDLDNQFPDKSRHLNIPSHCTINIKYPDGNYPDGQYEFNTFWYDGLYLILDIEHSYNNGQFTQTLHLLSVPVENPELIDQNNTSRDCFETPAVNTNISNINKTTPSTINSNDQSNSLGLVSNQQKPTDTIVEESKTSISSLVNSTGDSPFLTDVTQMSVASRVNIYNLQKPNG